MTSNYVYRPVTLVSLPAPDGLEPIRMESVVALIPGKPKLDLGCICYLKRKFGHANENKGPTTCKVDLSSFDANRVELVKRLLRFINDEVEGARRRPATVYKAAISFRYFMNWCDRNCLVADDCSQGSFEAALGKYVDHLWHLLQTNARKVNTLAKEQNEAIEVLRILFNSDAIGRGLNLLQLSNTAYDQTPVPDEADQSKALAWLNTLFHGCSDLVLENAQYPYQLRVPAYLNWPGNFRWAFPFNTWVVAPGESGGRVGVLFEEGRIATREELKSLLTSGGHSRSCSTAYKELVAHLEEGNRNPRHRQRLFRAMTAMSAFVELFISETAMNPAQVMALPWSEEFDAVIHDATIERQGFRTIKYRAGDRVVAFEIGTSFLADFRKFVRLRAYLLGDESCDTLFFSYSANSRWQFVPFNSSDIYFSIHRLDPSVRPISASEWRAAKQDWAIRNTDPSTAARLLQHSEKTALRSYSNGSETTQRLEMGEFFRHVDSVLLERGAQIQGSEDTSLGVCISPEHPKSLVTGIAIKPTCGKPEGCLFCDKFRVHADEVDIRKLLSCRFCVQATLGMAESEEQHQEVFGPVLRRIEFILGELAQRLPDDFARLKIEVDEQGELTPYWQAKFELLLELGLV